RGAQAREAGSEPRAHARRARHDLNPAIDGASYSAPSGSTSTNSSGVGLPVLGSSAGTIASPMTTRPFADTAITFVRKWFAGTVIPAAVATSCRLRSPLSLLHTYAYCVISENESMSSAQ